MSFIGASSFNSHRPSSHLNLIHLVGIFGQTKAKSIHPSNILLKKILVIYLVIPPVFKQSAYVIYGNIIFQQIR